MRKSRGFTLVEMSAVMAVSTVLLTLATGAVHRAMRIESDRREQADTLRSLTRLSHNLRRDTHEAQSAKLTQQPLGLDFLMPNERVVRYTVTDNEFIRQSTIPGEQTQREYYKKPADYHAAITTTAAPEMLDLLVTRETKVVGEPPKIALHVKARIGRFARLVSGLGGTP
jgi:prepilin-type N-terminal cleavage/methylation domain-containing protein